jgi:hypothetical protein
MKLGRFEISTDLAIKIVMVVLLISFAIFARVMPHPANFAPIAAIAIFGGAILPRRWAVLLPLAAIILSDLVIGMHSLFLLTWGVFAAIALLSNYWLRNINVVNVGLASIGASVLFYLVTNFGVWAEGRMYPMTIEGLMSSYYNALPFFRNTLMGDMAYTAMLFGTYSFMYRVALRRKGRLALSRAS